MSDHATRQLIVAPAAGLIPARLYAPTPKAAKRVLEFFTAQINNDHTRKAYLNAARRFSQWCEARGLDQLTAVQPVHVAAFVKELQGQFAPPTVKQHLAALRMLFDWLVTGHIIDVNPAHAVRGPKYVVQKGKTPVLSADEARALLDAIDTGTLTGLRDRALIGVMVYSFARVNAVLSMKVKDLFHAGPPRLGAAARERWQGARGALPPFARKAARRLHRRRRHRRRPPTARCSRSTGRKTGEMQALWQQDVYRDDPAPRGRRRDRRRSARHLPRHRHHRVSEKQGHAGTRADDRQPRLAADHQALRSAQ